MTFPRRPQRASPRPTASLTVILALALAAPASPSSHATTAEFYSDHLKPLLQARCYACHGALAQRGGLRLDTVANMRTGGDSGDVLSPSSPLLITKVSHLDPDLRMPPEGEATPLSPDQIAALQAWVEAGAPAPPDEIPEPDPGEHWAFLPPTTHGTSLDAVLSATLSSRQLVPQPPAQPALWLRRAYLNLTGLPPSPDQIRDFLAKLANADDPATVKAQTVDSLLASTAYAERWARHFMDIWRYSDWYGLDDQLRYSQPHLYHWRDWIIESLAADKPYHTMLAQMLAADELDPLDLDNLRATGFLARSYYLFNRTTWLDATVEHTSRAFIGITMQCAKCHDHKYDPISQDEYYQMRAIFEPHHVRLDPAPGQPDPAKDAIPRAFDLHLDRPTFVHTRGEEALVDTSRAILPGVPSAIAPPQFSPQPVALPSQAHTPSSRPHVLADHLLAAQASLDSASTLLAQAQAALDPPSPTPAEFIVSDDFSEQVPGRFTPLAGTWLWQDASLLQSTVAPARQNLQLDQPHPANFYAALHFSTIGGQQWRSVGLVFDSTDHADTLVYLSAADSGQKLQLAFTSGDNTSYPPTATQPRQVPLDTPILLELRVKDDVLNVSVDGQLALASRLPQRPPEGRIQLVTYDAEARFSSFKLAALDPATQLSPPGDAPPATTPTSPEQAITLAELSLAAAQADVARIHAVFQATSDPDIPDLAAQAAAAQASHQLALALLDLARAEHHPDISSPDETKKAAATGSLDTARSKLATAQEKLAAPGTSYTPLPASLKAQEGPDDKANHLVQHYPDTSTGRRLALARWITSDSHPLTARVIVNHVWLRHFGESLVEDVSDFGRRTPAPPLQHVLDTLARQFMDQGWSLRWLHRELVLSDLYARSSSAADADPHTLAADPDNILSWRSRPRRLESQAIRDSLLHIAGTLDHTTGGPTIDPASAAHTPRRSLYFNQTALVQHPFLAPFDNANVLECYRRLDSIMPQQALALANSNLPHETASALASRLGPLPDATFITEAFLSLLGRPPSAEEADLSSRAISQLGRPLFLHTLVNHNDFITLR